MDDFEKKIKESQDKMKLLDEQMKKLLANGGMESANEMLSSLMKKAIHDQNQINEIVKDLQEFAKKFKPMIDFLNSEEAKKAMNKMNKSRNVKIEE